LIKIEKYDVAFPMVTEVEKHNKMEVLYDETGNKVF
jgi:hypothetical protein